MVIDLVIKENIKHEFGYLCLLSRTRLKALWYNAKMNYKDDNVDDNN